jgi:hypothetical protein
MSLISKAFTVDSILARGVSRKGRHVQEEVNLREQKSEKTLGNLQDLRQGIYGKREAEVVGWRGVDAGEISASKAPPIGYVSLIFLRSEQESGVREICMNGFG